MHSTIRPLILAGVLSLALTRAAASPLAGHWVGAMNGRRAVALDIRDEPKLEGNIVFYILRDDGNGEDDGDATEPLAMLHLNWDGRALHFDVAVGDRSVSFEMSSDGNGKAMLKRAATQDTPALTIELSALR